MLLVRLHVYRSINPLPQIAILGSTNSAANTDIMSKIWINGIQLSDWVEILWEKEELLVTSNFFFSHNVFKSCLC